ncbi:hypothetical protein DITRI_Ditri07aG0095700 [Diplodiscus trichospermus]
MWNGLSLSDEEEEVLIEKERAKEADQIGNHCLIGRLLIKKPVNIDSMKNALCKAWKVKEDVIVKEEPEAVNLDWCSFWVQLHGLPLRMMTERIGIAIGESIGDVEEVETCGEKVAWGKYRRVRILIDTTKPLKRRKLVALDNGTKIMVQFRYERLTVCLYGE